MKRFRFRADIQFMAENLDDAFGLLADHFRDLWEGEEDTLLDVLRGKIDLQEVSDLAGRCESFLNDPDRGGASNV